MFLGFGENLENGSGVVQTGNETGSKYLKNGTNDLTHLMIFFKVGK